MGLRGPGATQSRPGLPLFGMDGTAGPDASRFSSVDPDADLADRVIQWIECLPVPSGLLAGKQMTVWPWQANIIRGLYPDDRRVRQAVISVPRKNGKTGLVSALALAHLSGPLSETHGEVYSAAADKAQAAVTFRSMRAIIEQTPELAERLIVRQFDKSIEDRRNGSFYKALSSDAATKHGLSSSFVVGDELAQWPHRELWDVLTTSTGARLHPLTVAISTQSPYPDHLMSELVDYARQVESGSVSDPTFRGWVWEAPESADPWSEEVWEACNPGLDTIRSREELRSMSVQAQRIHARQPAFRNLYLNQRVRADAGFLPTDEWLACRDDYDEEDLYGEACYIGLDLASVSDLAAISLYFPETGRCLSWGWVPDRAIADEGRIPWSAWEQLGYIFRAGASIDKAQVVRHLFDLAEHFQIEGMVYDRWGMVEFERVLNAEGIWGAKMYPWGQGYRDMSPAIAGLEAAILNRHLKHNMNPLLNWSFGNLVVDTDPAGNRKWTKSKAKDKIDPIQALTMAVGAALRDGVQTWDFQGLVLSL